MKLLLSLLTLLMFTCSSFAQEDDIYYSPKDDTISKDKIELKYSYYSIINKKEVNYIEVDEACLDIRFRNHTTARLHQGATMLYLTKNDLYDKNDPTYFVGTVTAFRNDSVYIIHVDENRYKEFGVAIDDITLIGYSTNPEDFVAKEGMELYENVKKTNLKKSKYSIEIRNKRDRKYNQTIHEFISPILLQILFDTTLILLSTVIYL